MQMKSKRFNAAEKHFQKKEEKLLAELHRARIAERNALAERDKIQQECDRLKTANLQLEKTNKILQAAADISDENLQLLIRNSQAIEQFVKLQNLIPRY
jgi:hypothetical protein